MHRDKDQLLLGVNIACGVKYRVLRTNRSPVLIWSNTCKAMTSCTCKFVNKVYHYIYFFNYESDR